MVNIAIHTPTQEDYIEIVSYLIEVENIPWSDSTGNGCRSILEHHWMDYMTETCIGINSLDNGLRILFADRICYKHMNWPILTVRKFYEKYNCFNFKNILKDFR